MILTNQDEKGIHYGVIPKNNLFNSAEEFYDNAKDMSYADVIDKIQEAITGLSDYLDEETIEDMVATATENFDENYQDDNALMVYEKDGYVIQGDNDDTDLFITKSPFYTFAPPCSPCAPGAGYLLSAANGQPYKTYCLDKSWFEDDQCPYEYFEVDKQ
jgi:hypothetical protein